MEIGFGIPNRGPLATLENLATMTQRGEEMGYDIVSVSDHIVVPNNIESVYPYNESGEFVSSAAGEYMEQLTTVSYLAGITSSIRLLTSVMVGLAASTQQMPAARNLPSPSSSSPLSLDSPPTIIRFEMTALSLTFWTKMPYSASE